MTGRICDTPGCGGALKDTIINFGEPLVQHIQQKGFDEHRKADLVIACGSSLRVAPASSMPELAVANGANFVNINLQKTPLDPLCTMNIFGLMDNVFELLMDKLGYTIPEFRLERRLKVSLASDKKSVNFTGIDKNGACFSLFKSITVGGLAHTTQALPSAKENVQPYKVAKAKNNGHFSVKLEFQGHYEEPCMNLKIPFALLEDMVEMVYVMMYSPKTGKWESVMIHDAKDECMGPSEYTEEAAPVREPAGQTQQSVTFSAKTTA